MVKFLIIGDLHGAMPKIYAKLSEFDAIIAPGDFCSDAPRKYMFKALKMWLSEGKDIDWYDLVGRMKAREMIKKSVKDGRRVMEFLNSLGKPVFITPGNWDWTEDSDRNWKYLHNGFYDSLIKGLSNVHDTNLKRISWKDFYFVGHGITSGPEYPQGKNKKRYKKKELEKKKKSYDKKMKKLSKLFERSDKKTIFLTHNVPYNTKLDKINNPASPRNGEHMGSVIARDLIKKHKPLLSVGGHMHEYHGKDKIGNTVAINAGFGGKVNTLVDIDEVKGKIRSIKFINKDPRKSVNRKVR